MQFGTWKWTQWRQLQLQLLLLLQLATLGSNNGLGGLLSAVMPADMGSIEVDAVTEAELKENGFLVEWWLW